MHSIVIVPFGDVPKTLLDFLREELGFRFGTEVRLSAAEPIPEGAFDRNRNQYRSSLFLRRLEEERQDEDLQETERRIGIVNVDLYNPESDQVLGEADPIDRVAVVSLARLHPALEGMPEEDPLFRFRLLKEAVHELGHLYQLNHCDNPKCVMSFSNALDDLDRKSADFCMAHQSKLKREAEAKSKRR
ncbi:MAG: archaemetzincin family Zn-dependent metalloprotease [Candidatus Manganitrophus sp.]|nr:archaemetzincin family Zn-dependent metalloprotease [Candidatus Manganitrophus sp.]WDT70855.1 MAG: archaemetzincin family Zn-dependent metalloprotease [Candidatus Manganitrophus sp.]WDT81875.1 MAG: archaemetzincin family Zn-dependent metalloprotease [Candidatus Manganitrophus sp.]